MADDASPDSFDAPAAEHAAEVHPALQDDETLWKSCTLDRVKRSGPGGQRRNKVETGVVLAHRPTGISVEASDDRSAQKNQTVALRRLRIAMAAQVRSRLAFRPVDEIEPSELWRSRTRGGRIQVNTGHDDFPKLLAEGLDVLFASRGDFRTAADRLGCSASQLRKLLDSEPAIRTEVLTLRERHGLPRLRPQ